MKRFKALDNTERETTCRRGSCRAKISPGQLRYWDSHRDAREDGSNEGGGVVCVSCFAKSGDTDINDEDKAPPKEGATKNELLEIKKQISAVQGSVDSLTLSIIDMKGILTKVAAGEI